MRQSDVPLSRYRWKRCFAGSKTGFTAFTVLFWALWWLFYIYWTYCCQNTEKNLSLPALKPILWHLPFFFEHYGGYFASIWCTVAKIWAKTLLHRLWNRNDNIRHIFLHTLGLICQSNLTLPKYERKHCFATFEAGFTVFAILFWALWCLFCVNRTYRC